MPKSPLTRTASRLVDQIAIQRLGFPGIVLMENAGRGAADVIQRVAPEEPVLIVCGRGNNAGDGFVVARHLMLAGRACRVALVSDPNKLAGDARTAFQMMQCCELPILKLYEEPIDQFASALETFCQPGRVLVDALLGTGAQGDPRPPYAAAIRWMNQQPAARIALDLPSGLDCDTGAPGEPTFRADHTCTFYSPKVGFAQPAASGFVGRVHVISIGIPEVDP